MADNEDMEYNLNGDNLDDYNVPKGGSNWPKPAKIILIIFIIICIALAAVLGTFIFLYINKSSGNSKKNQDPSTPIDPSEKQEPTKNITRNFTQIIDLFNFFGRKYSNLTYDNNSKIKNTFKKGGDNYNENVGEIKDGKDYEKNERNIYDLYIPQYALDRKNETNGIILWIHGGAWIEGTKDGMDAFCKLYSQQGYISATLSYTLLNSPHKDFNIFKILDEITACVKAIKNQLINEGFAGDKLKLVIGGYSAGGHLTLLYSYLIKKFEIPIEFLIDYVGPVGLYPKYFQKLQSANNTFENIEDVSELEQAIKDGKIVPVFDDLIILQLMNAFLGNKYSNDDIKNMLDSKGKINEDNDKYKEMLKVVKFGFITEIDDNNKTPTICIYGGTDNVVGVTAYAYLKQKANKDGRHLELIYSRYEGHGLIIPSSADGFQKVFDANSLTMKYLKKYFGY